MTCIQYLWVAVGILAGLGIGGWILAITRGQNVAKLRLQSEQLRGETIRLTARIGELLAHKTQLTLIAHDLRGNPAVISATRQAVAADQSWQVTVEGKDFQLGGPFRQVCVHLVNGLPAVILRRQHSPDRTDHIYPDLISYKVETS